MMKKQFSDINGVNVRVHRFGHVNQSGYEKVWTRVDCGKLEKFRVF